jgi:hypothetical protein
MPIAIRPTAQSAAQVRARAGQGRQTSWAARDVPGVLRIESEVDLGHEDGRMTVIGRSNLGDVLRVSSDATEEPWLYRIGGIAAVVGALLALFGNLLHPETAAPGEPETARVIAESQIWIPLHIGLILGFVLMLGGLVAIGRSMSGGIAGALAHLGAAAAIIGTSVGVILLTTDGFASKHLASAWLDAPEDQKAFALASFQAEQAIDFALLSPLNFIFAGFTFILFGLANAVGRTYPRWLGWVAVIGGVGGAISGVIQAYMGEPTEFSVTIGIAAPTIITLWTLAIGVLLLRRVPEPGL